MLITALTMQNNNPDRLSLYLDDEFACGLQAQTAVRFSLAAGQQLDEKVLFKIKQEDEYYNALQRALEYAGRTAGKSRWDFEQKLAHYLPETRERVLKRLGELGYINDDAIAAQTVQRALDKGEGRLMIKQRLMMKHMEENCIASALDNISPEDEMSAAAAAFAAAAARCTETDGRKRSAKIYSALARRGFSYDIISCVTEQYDED